MLLIIYMYIGYVRHWVYIRHNKAGLFCNSHGKAVKYLALLLTVHFAPFSKFHLVIMIRRHQEMLFFLFCACNIYKSFPNVP